MRKTSTFSNTSHSLRLPSFLKQRHFWWDLVWSFGNVFDFFPPLFNFCLGSVQAENIDFFLIPAGVEAIHFEVVSCSQGRCSPFPGGFYSHLKKWEGQPALNSYNYHSFFFSGACHSILGFLQCGTYCISNDLLKIFIHLFFERGSCVSQAGLELTHSPVPPLPEC